MIKGAETYVRKHCFNITLKTVNRTNATFSLLILFINSILIAITLRFAILVLFLFFLIIFIVLFFNFFVNFKS